MIRRPGIIVGSPNYTKELSQMYRVLSYYIKIDVDFSWNSA